MARPMWRGSLSFGLVNIPIGMYTATVDRRPHFHQFERGTADRVRNKRVNERTGDEVEYDDVVKGTEVSDGYVLVEPEELEAIAPGRSRLIEITQFVDGEEIDPVYHRKTYYLAPDGDDAAKAYGLLRDALTDSGKVAIASFVMRGQQYLSVIRPGDPAIILDTLYFADEVRSSEDQLPELPKRNSSGKKERDTAVSLIESMTDDWDPTQFTDTYRERVDELVDEKAKGEEVVEEGEPPDSTNVVDLMEALERSVSEARGKKSGKGGKAGTQSKNGKRSKSEPDPSELSKKDLDALARDLDVSGRSKMSRKELERAVAGAKKSGGKKAS